MDADLYHQNNQIELKGAIKYLEKYGSRITWKKINKIIDVGCGEGTVITKLKYYFPKDVTILGCDKNSRMIELANENYSDENTSFIVLDIVNDLPDSMNANYSHVFSFYCLNWIKDQKTAFSNIYELLEPDGECFLLIVSYSSIFDVYRRLVQNEKWKKWVYDIDRYISPYCDSKEPEKEIKMLMESLGFDNIFVGHDVLLYSEDDMRSLRGTMLSLCPFKIPSDKLDEFWDDYKTELRQVKWCEDSLKNIIYHFNVLTVYAHKPNTEKDFNIS